MSETLEEALRDIAARSFGVSGLSAVEVNRWFNERARAVLEGTVYRSETSELLGWATADIAQELRSNRSVAIGPRQSADFCFPIYTSASPKLEAAKE